MARVFDVAASILQVGTKAGPMSGWKLQKLVYYSQAWHLVWVEAPLFEEKIEAWANGPVVESLYQLHRGMYAILRLKDKAGETVGDPSALSDSEHETVNIVVQDYGIHDGHWLSELTHLEAPWKLARARAGCRPGDRCNEEIRIEDMEQYYGGLLHREIKQGGEGMGPIVG